MRHLNRWGPLLSALLAAVSLGCEAADSQKPLRNESALTVAQLGALLEEVKHADAVVAGASPCRQTGDAAPSAETGTWLAKSSPRNILRAVKAPPYALDPRDVELTLDIGRSQAWLIVTVRVQAGQCVGYSLSMMYI